MLKITLSPDAKEKLKALIDRETDYAEPFFRIQVIRLGTG